MIRLDDWHKKLATYIDSVVLETYLIGHHDCYTYTLGAVSVITGIDLVAEYKNKYRTLTDGLKIIRNDGGFSNFISNLLDIKARKSIYTFRYLVNNVLNNGDVVLFTMDGDMSLHIGIYYRRSITFPSSDGLIFTQGAVVKEFWSIP